MRVLRQIFAAAALAASLAAVPASATTPAFEAKIAAAKGAMLANPPETIAQAKQAEALAAREADPNTRRIDAATARWLQGEAYLRLGSPEQAKPLILGALRDVSGQGTPTKLNGDILLSSGGLHAQMGDVGAALTDYQAAHNIFRQIGETRSRAIALLSIASLYGDAKDYVSALKYYGQALDVYGGDPALAISIYNNRGNALKELKRFAESNAQFGKALALARQLQSPALEAQVLRNIAREQLLAGDLDSADRTIAEGLKLTEDPKAESGRGQMLSVAAQAALQRHDLRRAESLIDQAFAHVDITKTTLSFREAHQTAFEIYRAVGRAKDALAHIAAQKRLDDDATRLATDTSTALMSARFDSTNQRLQIQTLKAQEAERSARFQRILFSGLAIAALIGVSMLGFGFVQIRRSRDKVRAANVDLASSNSALEKALAAKTEFLATTSHEIRTPLNGILGMTQVMLADQNLPAVTRDRIGVVHGAGVTMRALVDDILDVAKMETGNLTIEAIPVDLCATLKDVTRMWEEQARAKKLDFRLELEGCPACVEGDPSRLRQIIFNLLSNAVKFTDAGTVSVRAEAAGDRLRIAVHDTGIGIDPAKQEEIFESFKQADGGTTRKYGGTGLGLAICRNLARAMQGDVTVESVPGEGATFTLDMPLREIERAPEPAKDDSAPSGGLLIVDKNPIARAMLKTVLEPRAGAVRFAASLEDAATALEAETAATVLVDEATAKMAGEDMAAGLSRLAEFPVQTAILWATPADDDRVMLEGIGFTVIAKPIAGPALAEQLYGAKIDQVDRNSTFVDRAA